MSQCLNFNHATYFKSRKLPTALENKCDIISWEVFRQGIKNQQGFGMRITYLKDILIQPRGNQKDFNFQLHHRQSKFEVPVVVNLKHIFELFGLYTTCFLIQKLLELIRSSSDGQFWRKSQNKKGGKFELRSQLCY